MAKSTDLILQVVNRFIQSYWEKRDINGVLDCCSSQVQSRGIGNQVLNGKDQIKQELTLLFANMPGYFTVHEGTSAVEKIGTGFYRVSICFSLTDPTLNEVTNLSPHQDILVKTLVRESQQDYVIDEIEIRLALLPNLVSDMSNLSWTFAQERDFQFLIQTIHAGIVVFELDPCLTISFHNAQFLAMIGCNATEFYSLYQNHLSSLIHEEKTKKIIQGLQTKQAYEIQCTFHCKRNESLWLLLQMHRIVTPEGKQAAVCTCLDVTNSVQLQKELASKNKQLQGITESIPGGVCLLAMEEKLPVLYCNEGFYALVGYSKEEMEKQFRHCLAPLIHQDDLKNFNQNWLNKKQKCDNFEMELRATHATGKPLYILLRCAVLHQDHQSMMSCIIIDTTQRKEMEEELRLEEERFRVATELSTGVLFDYDPKTSIVIHTTKACQLHGLPPIIEGAPEYYIKHGYVSKEYADEFKAMYDHIKKGQKTATCTICTNTATGRSLWNRFTMTSIFDNHNKTVRAIGLIEDITAQKDAELSFAKEEQYRIAMMSGATSTLEVDLTDDVVEKVTGDWAEIMKDCPCRDYSAFLSQITSRQIHPEDRQKHINTFSKNALLLSYALDNKEIICELRRASSHGKMMWGMTTIHLIKDPVTQHIKGIGFLKNIDDEKRKQLEMQYRSQRDSLTGLLNKKSTEDKITEILRSNNQALHAFLILDVDHFKQINDHYGHLYGDQILSQMAHHISDIFRYDDIIGRIGGDEFVVFLRNCSDVSIATYKANQICEFFHDSNSNEPHLSCSIGISFSPINGMTFDQLYQRADIALYYSKREGRNQYHCYQASMETQYTPSLPSQIDSPIMMQNSFKPVSADLQSIQLLEELNDLIYIADPVTHELIYLNRKTREDFDLDETYVGKKCYQVIQGRDTPCPYCTNKHLTYDETYVWQHTNELLKRTYIVKDKLIDWNNKPARFEFAMDITDQCDANHELQLRLDQEKALLVGLRNVLDAPQSEQAILAAMASIAEFYQASRVFYSEDPLQSTYQLEWKQEKLPSNLSFFHDLIDLRLDWFREQMKKNSFLCIGDISEIRTACPDLYWPLYRNGIAAFLACQLAESTKLPACLFVENPTCHIQDSSFLQSIIYYLSSELAKRKMNEELHARIYIDPLTGLLNRYSYTQYLQQTNPEKFQSIGVIVGDINGLKQINENFGHAFGDKTVKEVVKIFQQHCDTPYLYRLSGDEFVVIFENILFNHFLQVKAQLQSSFETYETTGVSIGSAWAQQDIDINELARHADEMMFIAKQKFHSQSQSNTKHLNKKILTDLNHSIENREFIMYLQPKVDLFGEHIVGAEALVRYQSTEYGIVPPGKFIPLLEKEHLIRHIDFFIFEEVCRLLDRWKKENRTLIPISLNFSRLTLLEDDLIFSMKDILQNYDVDSALIEIEITETVGEMERETIRLISQNLKNAGFHLSLDDFGTKYTNLSMLTVGHFDMLKLDRSLVNNLVDQQENRTVVEYVIAMCERLGIPIIAEGVETVAQQELLKNLGCHLAQGYLFGKPLPVQEFEILQVLREKLIKPTN